tara:strand:+ start:874 stop:1071 length:198 start_codon:yes stop_codon:yes gene_type:complete
MNDFAVSFTTHERNVVCVKPVSARGELWLLRKMRYPYLHSINITSHIFKDFMNEWEGDYKWEAFV